MHPPLLSNCIFGPFYPRFTKVIETKTYSVYISNICYVLDDILDLIPPLQTFLFHNPQNEIDNLTFYIKTFSFYTKFTLLGKIN